jgi:hypothetical protein
MSSSSVTALISKRISDIPSGKPFLTKDFLDLGDRAAVDKALGRMVDKGLLVRLARGIYTKPKSGVYVKQVKPSLEAVAKAVAESNDSGIAYDGAKALQLLGLTTQEPVQPIFITNGPSRNFKYGNFQIQLKHKRRMPAGLNGRAALAYSAFLYLGKGQATSEMLSGVLTRFSPEELQSLMDAQKNMPSWFSSLLRKAEART